MRGANREAPLGAEEKQEAAAEPFGWRAQADLDRDGRGDERAAGGGRGAHRQPCRSRVERAWQVALSHASRERIDICKACGGTASRHFDAPASCCSYRGTA